MARPSFARPHAPPSANIRHVDRPTFRGNAAAAATNKAAAGGATVSRRDFAVQRTQGWRNRRAAERAIRNATREDARTARSTNAKTSALASPNALSQRDLAVQRTQGWRNRRAAAREVARAERLDARASRTGSINTAFGALPPARNMLANRNLQRAALGSAAAIGAGFAARQATHAQWYRDWRRRRIAFGWFGPVYWPYAYDTIFVDLFWPYYAPYYVDYDPFWDYGYPDIYAGMFSPYAYDEVFASPPSRRRYASAPPRSSATDSDVASALREVSPACGDDSRDLAGVPVDDIAAAVQPNDAQRTALDALGNASVKAAQIVKAACPTTIALTPVGRLEAMQQRVDAMLEAVKTLREPLDAFYGQLADEQKARFNTLGDREERNANPRALARSCSGASEATAWPAAQIQRAVRPNAQQAESLAAVQRAAQQAASSLKASCPSDVPATPTARLAAMQTRLEAMRDAVRTVREPLAAFYASLNDEQKGQFNAIGRARAGRE